MKKRSLLIFYTIFIACLECIFHIRAYGDFNVIYLFLFTIPIIIFLYLLASLWRPQVNKIITHVIVVVTTIIFMAQLVYFEIYHAIFSVGAITLAGQVATFYDQILAVIEDNIIYLLLMLIPMILYFVYHNKFLNYDRKNYLECLYFAGGALLFHAMIVLSLSLNNVGVYSLYNLYHNINSPLLTSKNMGLLTEIRIDLKRTIFGFEEKLDSLIVGPTNPKPSQPEIEWNQLDIDFDAYIEEEKNENIKTMHQYFKNQSVTEKNQYTGLLKDKNVIFIMAESFDEIAIDKDLTPTLYKLKNEGKNVLIAAGDTFRAAAVEQLEVWSKRAGCDIIKAKENADPASVVFEAIKRAKENNIDVLICDTAGRLHNKKYLMDELNKIQKVINKEMQEADKEVLLVIDGTTGQNAISQVKAFKEEADITGLVLTKLDGTAKGGVVIGIVEENKIPVKFIGVGEQIDDMEIFDSNDFVKAII